MTPDEALDFIEQVRLQVSMRGDQADTFRMAIEVLRREIRSSPPA